MGDAVPALLLSLLFFVTLAVPAHAADVDAAIVFAVDASASVDRATARMQRDGHAMAISDPAVVAAISQGPSGCIAVTYMEWASPGQTRSVLPWRQVCRLEDALSVARAIRQFANDGDRCRSYCATSISDAIDSASTLLDRFVGVPLVKIIDISANGTNNDGAPLFASRARAIARGFTINAIVAPQIRFGVPRHLTDYFGDFVIGGEGAFVIEPETMADYAFALRRKLISEISFAVDRPELGRDTLPIGWVGKAAPRQAPFRR
nr:DUF1194 domain-containing protein [Rhizobium sp. ARZ01]